MFFSGSPAKRSRNIVLQATSKPQLAGRKGAISEPPTRSSGAQAASEPSLGQLAPPSARMVTRARTVLRPLGSSIRRPPMASQPLQVERGRSDTPRSSRRESQARSRGEAFIALGKTRPLAPTKVV